MTLSRIPPSGYDDASEISFVQLILAKSGISSITNLKLKPRKDFTDIDILAIYGNVIILIQCAGKADLRQKISRTCTDFKHIGSHFDIVLEELKKQNQEFYENHKEVLHSSEKVLKKLLAISQKETRKSIDDAHRQLCEENDLVVWTQEELYYYQAVSECTYHHCKYEIFDDLNVRLVEIEIKREEPRPRPYPAYGVKVTGDIYLLNFVLPVSDLLERASIRRLRDSSEKTGYQRLLNKNKLRKMRQYLLSKQSFSTYPNNIICSLHPSADISEYYGRITIRSTDRSEEEVLDRLSKRLYSVSFPDVPGIFEIIDGQHRLFSFAQTQYATYEKIKGTPVTQLAEEDAKIRDLASNRYLTVTAVYSKNNAWGEPGKLFFDINTQQTRIGADDVIDLIQKYDPQSPKAHANDLLQKLNSGGVLRDKIKVKFWQTERIKRPSLISYSGLAEIFDEENQTYHIYHDLYESQTLIKDDADYCACLINNFLWTLVNLAKSKCPPNEMSKLENPASKEYYLFSAVYVASAIRLLRHFLTKKDKEFGLSKKVNSVLAPGRDAYSLNIDNEKLQDLFKPGLQILANLYSFRFDEPSYSKNGWRSNSWARIESDLFYAIREKYEEFGDEALISSKLRR